MRRVEEQERRIAEIEARLNELPKNSDNSNEPPSKGFKSNKGKGKSERVGPRQGSLGRKGCHSLGVLM